jgi:2-polyprenyl-6-methoxyphenol hydroxylase-like FAD-dependent oxidoreductase
MKTDVIIVGAGPTGLALASQLMRYGIDFVIFDQKETTTPFSKAIGVQARTLEIYEQIGLADPLLAAGAKAEKARLVEGGEVRGEIELADLGEGLSPYPFMLIVEQGIHEKILYEHLRAAGRDVRWRTALENFSQDANGVTAGVRTAGGAPETIEAKFLVGCDGAKSFVRHALGLTFEGSTFERLFYVADVEIDWEFSHDALHVCLAQNTITAFFPMPGEKHWRIVGTFPENHDKDEGDILYEEIERQIIADTELKLDITSVKWFSVYRVHSRRVNKFGLKRCFVAGDAAHIHTPAGAQGMNTGIQDGYNLAWKLALVLRGKAGLKLLETYDEERSANAKRLLQTTDRVFDFGASEEPALAFFRTRIFPHIANFVLHFDAVKKFIFPLVSQIGINYRASSLSRSSGVFKIRAGDRMPYFTVDGASVYEKLKAPRFHLLTFFDGENRPGDLTPILGTDLVDYHEFNLFPHIAKMFGKKQTFTVLLRPDNYIGLITEENSAEELSKYLNQL